MLKENACSPVSANLELSQLFEAEDQEVYLIDMRRLEINHLDILESMNNLTFTLDGHAFMSKTNLWYLPHERLL